ncbi:MAG: tetratricopeptide repeat protein [bacterium]
MKWFRRAAEHGDAAAQSNLGGMYGEGQGVPQDDVLAHMWFSLAAAQGNEEAVKNRDIVEKEMWPWNVWKAERLAREWLETHPR